MTNVIEVRDMSFGYTQDKILEHVSFNVEKGDFAIVIGDNGVGKSTMVKLLLGVLKPTSGEILVEGKPLVSISKTNIGYLAQNGGSRAGALAAFIRRSVLHGSRARHIKRKCAKPFVPLKWRTSGKP